MGGLPLARYAAVPGAEMLHVRPPTKYASVPPALFEFRWDHADMARSFLRVLARGEVAVPAEAVMLYRDAVVLDGRFVIVMDEAGGGVGVEESFADAAAPAAVEAAWREAPVLGGTGPPVVAIFKEHCQTFGHVVGEMLPKLVHLADMGVRAVRLLLPGPAEPLRDTIAFVVSALGMRAEFVACPDGSAWRVPALHWVSPVSRYNQQVSPTLLRLMERLRAAAPAGDGPKRLFVTRPARSRRRLSNAAEAEAVAAEAGFTVVEPSAMPMAQQVALFAGAEWVAGAWGSGLTLCAAMAPGGRVTMVDSAVCDFFFWDIACLAGLRFDWAFTARVQAGRYELVREDMAIEPELLRALLGTA